MFNEMSEAQFQEIVLKLARMYRWQTFHPSPHQVGQSWRTDGRGFPDLTLAHPTRGVIFAELKTEKGRVTEAQRAWGDILAKYGEYYVWRPSQLPLIEQRLGQER